MSLSGGYEIYLLCYVLVTMVVIYFPIILIRMIEGSQSIFLIAFLFHRIRLIDIEFDRLRDCTKRFPSVCQQSEIGKGGLLYLPRFYFGHANIMYMGCSM